MRKVLLTTTALVALGGVSAASALDIDGYQRMTYSSWDDTATTESGGANDSKMDSYTRLQFKHSVTGDSGLSASMFARINNGSESYEEIKLTGDFGSFSMGDFTSPGNWYYNSHKFNGTFVDDNAQTFSGVNDSAVASQLAATMDNITYESPNIAGFNFMISQGESGVTSEANPLEIGVIYSATVSDMGVTLHTISSQADDSTGSAGDEQDNIEYGVKVTSGPIDARYSYSSNEKKSAAGVTTNDIQTSEYSVTYKASDALTAGIIIVDSKDPKDTTNNPKLDETVFAANYTIIPGLRLQASYVDFDYEGATNNSGSQTNLALRIDF
jgi:predicted porin